MRPENADRRHTLIGRILSSGRSEPKYVVIRSSVKQTHNDPQVWEMECTDRTLLYARFNKGELTCKEKRTGDFICSGSPQLHRDFIPIEKVEFYLEMYSKHNIYFQ